RLEPEFRGQVVAIYMNVRRLRSFVAVEVDPVWPNAQNGRHPLHGNASRSIIHLLRAAITRGMPARSGTTRSASQPASRACTRSRLVKPSSMISQPPGRSTRGEIGRASCRERV